MADINKIVNDKSTIKNVDVNVIESKPTVVNVTRNTVSEVGKNTSTIDVQELTEPIIVSVNDPTITVNRSPIGLPGTPGDTGEIRGIGTVNTTTLPAGSDATANVVEVGDLADFTFGIPQGSKGDDGLPGVKGDDGDSVTGPKGDAFVYSDFTSAELLALKGNKGDTGEDGDNGTNGTTITSITKDGTTVSVALSNGTTDTFNVPNGINGAKGDTGDDGDAFVYSDFTSAELLALKGSKGDDGTNGTNGTTITSITKSGETVSVNLSNSTSDTFMVPDGDKGDDGLQGPEGAQGVSITGFSQAGLDDDETYILLSNGQSDLIHLPRGAKGEPGESVVTPSPLGFVTDDLDRTLTTYNQKPISTVTLINGLYVITLAEVTLSTNITSQSLNWDQSTDSISASADNDPVFPEQYIDEFKDLTYDSSLLGEATVTNSTGDDWSNTYTNLTLLDARSSFTSSNSKSISIIGVDTDDNEYTATGTITWNSCSANLSQNSLSYNFLDISDKTYTANVNRSSTSSLSNFPLTEVKQDGTTKSFSPSDTTITGTASLYKGNTSVPVTAKLTATRPLSVDASQPTVGFDLSHTITSTPTFSCFSGFADIGHTLTIAEAIALSGLNNVSSNSLVGTQRSFNNGSSSDQTLWIGLRTSDASGIGFEVVVSGVAYPTTPAATQTLTLVPDGTLPTNYVGEAYSFYGFNIDAGVDVLINIT